MNGRKESKNGQGIDEALAPEQLLKYAQDVASFYQNLKEENERLEKANRELEANYYQTFLMGFDLIALHNEHISGHCRRVALFSKKLAEPARLTIF